MTDRPTSSSRSRGRSGVIVGDLTVVILDRPRHTTSSTRSAQAGARIKFITDGDVAGAI